MESNSETKPKPLLTVFYGYENPSFAGDTYHMIFVICDKEGTAVAWTDLNVQWTDSSEAYYQDALKYDLIG